MCDECRPGGNRRRRRNVYEVACMNGQGAFVKFRRRRDTPDDSEYAPYAGTGPGFKKGDQGDETLAYKAQLHHYQQAKQKIICGDGASGTPLSLCPNQSPVFRNGGVGWRGGRCGRREQLQRLRVPRPRPHRRHRGREPQLRWPALEDRSQRPPVPASNSILKRVQHSSITCTQANLSLSLSLYRTGTGDSKRNVFKTKRIL